jgi:hypothetical protein
MWVTKHQNGAADGLSNDWAAGDLNHPAGPINHAAARLSNDRSASDLNHAAPITSAGDRNDPLDLGPLSDP